MGFPIAAFFLAASYFTSLLPLSKELMVTFPNKASEIKRGKLLRITWSTNATEGVVSVSLMSKSIHTANQKVLSLGQLNVHLEELEWIVPFDIPPGTQYYIMIESQQNVFCSESFTIDSDQASLLDNKHCLF